MISQKGGGDDYSYDENDDSWLDDEYDKIKYKRDKLYIHLSIVGGIILTYIHTEDTILLHL